MPTLEYKLKRAALSVAVDITLRGKDRSPERCARNLMELGGTVRPQLTKEQRAGAYEQLLAACRTQTFTDCRALFISLFLEEQGPLM